MKIHIIALFIFISLVTHSQLVAGDIAFIGFNTDNPEGFSIITLTDIPGNTQIQFTDRGIVDASNWNIGIEENWIFTAPSGGISCGTIVSFVEVVTGSNVYTITGAPGSSMIWASGSIGSPNINHGPGDQMIAYQTASPGMPTAPNLATFIAGIHTDSGGGVGTTDPSTNWNLSGVVSSTTESAIPPGLTNGVNCLSFCSDMGVEYDNFKYTGTLTGTSTVLRASINNIVNWSNTDVSSYAINPIDYSSPLVSCVTLPVELTEFSTVVYGEKVKLYWTTISELNNKSFSIERSIDLNHWETIGEVKGAVNSVEKIYYEWIDQFPQNGDNYYRLKQIDIDGYFKFSDIKMISISNREVLSENLVVYPNPAIDDVINVTYKSFDQKDFMIYDLLGRDLFPYISSVRDKNNLRIDISQIPKGIFIICIENQYCVVSKL